VSVLVVCFSRNVTSRLTRVEVSGEALYAYLPMIELIQLRKEYENVLAVDDLSITIPQGEIFGWVGPSGAGKTTTILMTSPFRLAVWPPFLVHLAA